MSRHRQGKSLIYGSILSMLILAEAAARSFSEAPSQIAPTSLSCVWGPNLFVRIFFGGHRHKQAGRSGAHVSEGSLHRT